jgi:hypothetical protein
MSQHYNQPAPATSRADRLTRGILLAVWVAFTAAALGFVLTFGTNVPYADEWEFVPALTGHEPFGPWLWQQHNEHRLPLPRAIYFALFVVTQDFRAGMVLQVAMLAALAFWLMRLASQLRGRPHWADAFFPVSLLHVGHWENFLMGYQLCFVLFTVLVTAIGVVALRMTRETAFRSGAIAGVLGVLLCLCGGFGLVAALPVAAWVAYLAVIVWRTGAKRNALVLLGLAVLPFLYLWLYQIGYERPSHGFPPGEGPPEPGAGGPRVVALVAGQTLAMAFGFGATAVWQWVCVGLLALGAVTIGVLVRDPNRPAVLGLIAVAAGVGGLALAIGIGRSGFGDTMGLWPRYSLLMWPLIGLAFLVWVKQKGRGAKWLPAALCIVAALFFQPNTLVGLTLGERVRARQTAIEADAHRGLPPEVIAYRPAPGTRPEDGDSQVGSGQEERAIRGIPMLRAAGVGAFAGK